MKRLVAICAVFLSVSCSARRVPTDAGSSNDIGLFSGDGPILLPDLKNPQGTDICHEGRDKPTLLHDERGDLTVALPPGVYSRRVEHTQGARAAQLFDHEEVLGFLLSRTATSRDPVTTLNEIQRSLDQWEDLHLSVRGSGTHGVSIDGYPDIKNALWEFSFDEPVELSVLRNRLFTHIFNEEEDPILPIAGGPTDTRFFCRLTLVMRDTQAMVMAACASAVHTNWALLQDLGNGTALAAHRQPLANGCERGSPKGHGVADILWIIDESESMDERRKAIVGHASRFFRQATAAGLDFRMAVTGMRNPLALGVIPGKLCSVASDVLDDDGGPDRFLSPNEKETFFACVENPPFRETHMEYGIVNAYEAVRKLLPRRANDPTRLRPDAKLVLVFATDEAAQEVKLGTKYKNVYGFLDDNDVGAHHCSLNKEDQLDLDRFIDPYVRFFADQQAMVHLIGGTCDNGCDAEIPYGYRELAQRREGQFGDVCRVDLEASLQVIVDAIVAASSPYRLQHVPVSSTLEVSANGWQLPRNKERGYSYDAAANSLSFIDVNLPLGTELVISYWRFGH